MSTIPRFLSSISKWPGAPALSDLWLMTFDLTSIPALRNRFLGNTGMLGALNQYEGRQFGGWNVTSTAIEALLNPDLQGQGVDGITGCIFARSVSLAGESVKISQSGLEYGSYTVPATSTSRSLGNTLSVNFLETNVSFIDLIIRPWIIMVGYYGLVARNPGSAKNIKCPTVTVYQLAKSGAFQRHPIIRQQFKFYNVAPTSLQSIGYEYTGSGFKERSVTFAYDGYAIEGPYTTQLIYKDFN